MAANKIIDYLFKTKITKHMVRFMIVLIRGCHEMRCPFVIWRERFADVLSQHCHNISIR